MLPYRISIHIVCDLSMKIYNVSKIFQFFCTIHQSSRNFCIILHKNSSEKLSRIVRV